MSLRPDILYITHPHADHLSDIETALHSLYSPDVIHMQEYDWADVKKRERPQVAYRIDKLRVLRTRVPHGDYHGNAQKLTPWRYTPEVARKSFPEASYLNNSSLFIIYVWRDFKIAVAGDQEAPAMEAYLRSHEFCASAAGTHILIPPHHGHTSSFTSLWSKNVGRPYVSIISAPKGDTNVDERYSTPEFAKGISFCGKKRFALTTRDDGNIAVRMSYSIADEPEWEFHSF